MELIATATIHNVKPQQTLDPKQPLPDRTQRYLQNCLPDRSPTRGTFHSLFHYPAEGDGSNTNTCSYSDQFFIFLHLVLLIFITPCDFYISIDLNMLPFKLKRVNDITYSCFGWTELAFLLLYFIGRWQTNLRCIYRLLLDWSVGNSDSQREQS